MYVSRSNLSLYLEPDVIALDGEPREHRGLGRRAVTLGGALRATLDLERLPRVIRHPRHHVLAVTVERVALAVQRVDVRVAHTATWEPIALLYNFKAVSKALISHHDRLFNNDVVRIIFFCHGCVMIITNAK